MNENITENIEEDKTAEQAAAESAVEETIIDNAATETEGEGIAAQAAKPKSKMFIAYILGFVIFMAAAVTALVCFGLYAYNLVHGNDETSPVSYSVEYYDINL